MTSGFRLSAAQMRRVKQTLCRIREGLSTVETDDLEPAHVFKLLDRVREISNGK